MTQKSKSKGMWSGNVKFSAWQKKWQKNNLLKIDSLKKMKYVIYPGVISGQLIMIILMIRWNLWKNTRVLSVWQMCYIYVSSS